MKNLEKYEKIINNCSRCGLCQAVCPVFEATKNDCNSPKGKFILLNAMLNAKENPSKLTKKYMKECLNCGKCLDYCPSKIDMLEINDAFNKDYKPFSFNIFNGFVCFLLIKYLIILIKSKIIRNNLPDLQSNIKILYIKSYKHGKISEITEKNKIEIIEHCKLPIKFLINNPSLYKKLAELFAEKIMKISPDTVITDSPQIALELEYCIKKSCSKIKIILLSEFKKKYLQVKKKMLK